MLAALFGVDLGGREPKGGGVTFGKGGRAPKARAAGRQPPRRRADPQPSDPCPAHAKFVPLPAETNAPAPAPSGARYSRWDPGPGPGVGAGHGSDDDEDENEADNDDFAAVWDTDDETKGDETDDEETFEPDSLSVTESVSDVGSLDDRSRFESRGFLGSRSDARQGVPVYSGPQLCFDDEDDDD